MMRQCRYLRVPWGSPAPSARTTVCRVLLIDSREISGDLESRLQRLHVHDDGFELPMLDEEAQIARQVFSKSFLWWE
jgi:hypothetical protein